MKKNKQTNLNSFFSNPKNQKIIGGIFILISVFVFISCISFLLNWTTDLIGIDNITNSEIVIQNILGGLGNFFGYIMVYKGFGISSIIIPFLIFIIGVKIAFKKNILPMKKTILQCIFFIITLPIIFALLFSFSPILSGVIGNELKKYLQLLIGNLGIFMVLTFMITLYIYTSFSFSFQKLLYIKKFFSKKENTTKIQNNIPPTNNETVTIQNENYKKELEFIVNQTEEKNEIKTTTQEKFEIVTPKEEIESLEINEVVEEQTVDKIANDLVQKHGKYDPKLDLNDFKFPSLELLKGYQNENIIVNQNELEDNKNRIVETLRNYKIEISSIKATIGSTITLYEIVPAPGVKISKIKNLEDDIALSLSALGIRIIAPMPGKGTIGIEVPNSLPTIVSMKSVISSEKFQNTEMDLPCALGKNISNETVIVDLTKMPHLLMAGATGQGKSVGLNAILTSLLYKKHPAELKFVLVDPKKVELTLFNKIERHYLAKLPNTEDAIITDTTKVVYTLNSLCIEMDTRYELLKDAMVRNIKEYNGKFLNRKLNPEHGHKFLPYIVLIIDEFADLIMTAGKEVETPIARLAQLARAIGIHLIVATQRPSVNVITGIIKANFPARIAFRVTSAIDSKTILDGGGANQLIGKGDMLYSSGNDVSRIQCAFVDTSEVEKITDFIGSQRGYPDALLLPEYQGDEEEIKNIDIDDRDAKFEEAARIVISTQQGSTSMLQRKLKLGYNRAGRIVDQLEVAGIIGPFEGSKARQVLIKDEASLEQILNN